MLILLYIFSQKNSSKDILYWCWNVTFPFSENNILTYHLGQLLIKRFIRFHIWYRNIAHKDKTTPKYPNEYWKLKLNMQTKVLWSFSLCKILDFFLVSANKCLNDYFCCKKKSHLICLWKADICWKLSSYSRS